MFGLNDLFNRQVSLLEGMMIIDGIINSINFTVNYIYYKIKQNIIKADIDQRTSSLKKENLHKYIKDSSLVENSLKQNLIKQSNHLYEMHFVDRYMLYFIIYGVYIIFQRTIIYFIYLTASLPFIQNKILNIRVVRLYYNIYCENREIFIFYSCSKFIISSIQNLNKDIRPIRNYHIFIMYYYLTFDNLIKFLKLYVFTYILYFLRSGESTYYYYKVIKFAFYYTNGYLFNNITIEDSVNAINNFVNDKQWCNIHKIEIVHAIYNLVSAKYKNQNNLDTTLYIYVLKFFTLWNIIFVLKILKDYVNVIILLIYLVITEYLYLFNFIDRVKNYIRHISIYVLLLLNINDLFISLFFVFFPVVYYIYDEVKFFILNVYDIKKVLDLYNKHEQKYRQNDVKLSYRQNDVKLPYRNELKREDQFGLSSTEYLSNKNSDSHFEDYEIIN
jgi:hypothetical protein